MQKENIESRSLVKTGHITNNENAFSNLSYTAPSPQPSFGDLASAVRHQRTFVAVVAAIGIILAAAAKVTTHVRYTGTAMVLMVAEPPDTNPQTPTNATKPLLSADLPSLATSATVLDRFKQDIGEPDATPAELRSHIRAKINLDSTLMPVEYTSKNPRDAVRGANFLATEITRFYREIAVKRFDSLIADLNAQLLKRREELGRLDAELADQAGAYPYIDVRESDATGEGGGSVYQRLIALRGESDDLQAAVKADGAAIRPTASLLNNARPVAVRDLLQNDAVYQHLYGQYSQDASQLQHLESFSNEKYPGLAELRDTVAREAQNVSLERDRVSAAGLSSNTAYAAALDAQARATVQLSSDQAKLATIKHDIDVLNTQIGGDNTAATNASRIRRERSSAEEAYTTIAMRLSKTIADRAEAGSTGSVVVIDKARVAENATWTNGTVIAIAVLVFAIWAAITGAVMIENRSKRFRNTESIELVYGAPLLGSLT